MHALPALTPDSRRLARFGASSRQRWLTSLLLALLAGALWAGRTDTAIITVTSILDPTGFNASITIPQLGAAVTRRDADCV